MYRVNVSSVQDFMQCRFRWWCKWVQNRVPVATSPALDAGRILHKAFERHAISSWSLEAALREECRLFQEMIPTAHPAAQPGALKAVQVMEDLIEAMPLWKDKFPIDKVLEIEEPFEYDDPFMDGVTWLGRPDRVVSASGRVWHFQRRGLAASINFGTYQRLQQRSYHEHLYAEALSQEYCSIPKRGSKKKRLVYGGTVFDLVRKLKFRTNVGKKNEETKTAGEMFNQFPMSVNLKSGLHASVMMALRQHVVDMRAVEAAWNGDERVPAPNEKMNGGYGGNSEDPYFRVLIGEVKLDDNEVFKDREDTYATADVTE